MTMRSILCGFLLVWATLATGAASPVALMRIEGAIGPATAEFIGRGLKSAHRDGAQLVVLQLDTPGGLDSSMRTIIKDILASEVPVATFVAPTGARAASAGTFIAYASHFAAMSPGTNLGAATPVSITGGAAPARTKDEKGGERGDAMTSKQVNDAAAYIRSLAELRGRNAEWGERAVREGASLSASEALRERVIDVVARDVPELLGALDGRAAKLPAGPVRLATAGAPVQPIEAGWRTRMLQVIADPSVALVLMMIGLYGLILEFGSPGFGVAGTLGAICLLLGLFALQMLPISYAGLALIGLGMALMVAEGLVPSFGILGFGGIVAFLLGGIILVREEDMPGFDIPLGLLAGLAVASAVITVVAVRFALRSRRLPQRAGDASLVGQDAQVIEAVGSEGWAYVRGERWKVRAPTALAPGEEVRVTGIHGLTLDVEPRKGPNQGG
jgi:membrane-bound serine protease (ClpP class)